MCWINAGRRRTSSSPDKDERERERERDAKQCDQAASKQAKKKKERKPPPSFQVFISFSRRLIIWLTQISVNNFHRVHLMFTLYFLVTSEERDVKKKKKQVNTNQTYLSKQSEIYKDVFWCLDDFVWVSINARSETCEHLGSLMIVARVSTRLY